MKNFTLIITILVTVVLATSCSDATFYEGGGDYFKFVDKIPTTVIADDNREAETRQEKEINQGELNLLQKFTIEENQTAVDVAFFIDTSNSMDDELRKVEDNLEAFVEALEADSRSKNFQVHVFAGEDDELFNPPEIFSVHDRFSFEVENHTVGSNNALGVAREFILGNLVAPNLELQSDSTLHLVFITDDEAEYKGEDPQGIEENDFREFLSDEVDRDLHIHGIVCPEKVDSCGKKGEGYINLAADPEFKGVQLDLTAEDWEPLFNQLVSNITNSISLEFKLENIPSDLNDILVFHNGVQLSDDEFAINVDELFLTVVGVNVEDGDEIFVRY